MMEESEEKRGSDGQVGVQVGRAAGASGLEVRKWAKLGWNWARLKEMGLGGELGGMDSGCLQFRFQTLFNVLALIFSTKVRSMQGQFLKNIDLNIFPSIYGTFFRSKPKKYGEFFNQRFLQCPGSPIFV